MGVEFIDIEQRWPRSLKSKIFNSIADHEIQGKRNSKIIVSEHCYDGEISYHKILHLFRLCEEQGVSDIVKVVIKSTSMEDTIQLLSAKSEYEKTSQKTKKPIIALATTEKGQLTRILNSFLCPVTHPNLPIPAAPGQLSIQEINAARKLVGCQDYFPKLPNNLYLFGNSISASPSPSMHNSAFQFLNIPLEYSLFSCESVDEIVSVLNQCTCKGGNITMPFKNSIISHLHSLTPAARCIDAVNTITKLKSGQLHGDNTDWLGICNPIVQVNNNKNKLKNALILGAGGTARAAIYALQFGLNLDEIFIWNPRTPENAKKLASIFNIHSCDCFDDIKNISFDVIVSTLPPVGVSDDVKNCFSQLLKNSLPIVMDVVYYPKNTAILQLSRDAGCCVIEGATMLLEQGTFAFEQWTNVRAPHSIMKKAILEHQHVIESKSQN